VERIYPLQQRARRRLQELHLRNVRMKHSDGGWGWEEYAPYDGIIVTAAPAEVPHALLDQLAPGGVLVIPVGDGRDQMLQRITRAESSNSVENIEAVVFVPLLAGVTEG
jgi:protein-L-isoaspartate(D-aspartate) O-methyltransferase